MELKKTYEGKAKELYEFSSIGAEEKQKIFGVKFFEEEVLLASFKNVLTAFNGEKVEAMEGKGQINRDMTSLLFRYLERAGIETHWKADYKEQMMLIQKIEMIPLEFVVRNKPAGSFLKKFPFSKGSEWEEPIFELFYKEDALGDPFMSWEQARVLKVISEQDYLFIQETSFSVNEILKKLFFSMDFDLVDFKLEFGFLKKGENKKIILGDEFSLDNCRLWDKEGNSLDKDRFRKGLPHVKESYQKVYQEVRAALGS